MVRLDDPALCDLKQDLKATITELEFPGRQQIATAAAMRKLAAKMKTRAMEMRQDSAYRRNALKAKRQAGVQHSFRLDSEDLRAFRPAAYCGSTEPAHC